MSGARWYAPVEAAMVRIEGGDEEARLGGHVRAGGDLTGDGLADLLLRERLDDVTRSWVVPGPATGVVRASEGLPLVDPSDRVTQAYGASDLDGDGQDDLAVLAGNDLLLLLGPVGAEGVDLGAPWSTITPVEGDDGLGDWLEWGHWDDDGRADLLTQAGRNWEAEETGSDGRVHPAVVARGEPARSGGPDRRGLAARGGLSGPRGARSAGSRCEGWSMWPAGGRIGGVSRPGAV